MWALVWTCWQFFGPSFFLYVSQLGEYCTTCSGPGMKECSVKLGHSLVLSYSKPSMCCVINVFLVDLFQTNAVTPERETQIKSFNAADGVITIEYMHSNPSESQMHRLTHIPLLWGHNKMHLGVRVGYEYNMGQRSRAWISSLCHPVGCHAVVVLTVATCRPHQKCGGHHVQWWGNEGQVEGPAQRAIYLIRQHWHPVEQVHPRQVTAHCG